ncbi:hypothetical protein [Streptomyces sp. KLOTTS4A1]|uniref:hypothetical protein n=1 Tax=Streptomyces sp. KLOTTS4A1 TaxID=3390996 RepID=UPI0039F6205F
MGFRLFRIAIPLAAVACLLWPALLSYTFVAGERATAQVAECHRGGSRSPLKCSGTWRTEGGERGSGAIYGLGRDDAGRSVEVRVGPLGPYHPGVRAAALPVVLSLFMLVGFGGMTVHQQRARRRVRPLLAQPAQPGDLLTVTGRGASTADGRRTASVVALPRPPAPVAKGVRAAYWDVRDGAGQPVCRVEKRRTGKALPELLVQEPSGAGYLIRPAEQGPRGTYSLLTFDGRPVGTVGLHEGAKWGAYEFRDLHGVVWARTVCRMPEWVLRLEPGAPAPFPVLALAFTTGQRRQVK